MRIVVVKRINLGITQVYAGTEGTVYRKDGINLHTKLDSGQDIALLLDVDALIICE